MSLHRPSVRRRTFVYLLIAVAITATSIAQAGSNNSVRYSDRDDVQQFIAEMVRDHEFDEATLRMLFATTRPIPRAVALIKPPADPGVRSWRTYRSRFIEPKRIAAGKRFASRYADELARAETEYGVPADIIAGIIGVETIYGKNTGDFNTFATLTTLAFDYPPRADLFRKELRELLLLARSEQRSPRDYVGSYAGALGLPQFLPSSIRAYGVDYDRDGHIDLLRSPVDAIGSVANYLSVHGWERGQPVATSVYAIGDGIEAAIAEGITPRRSANEWQVRGVVVREVPQGFASVVGAMPEGNPYASETAQSTQELTEALRNKPAALIDLVTPGQATEYRLGYQNFYVITRYNKSTFYASAVMDLAAALR